MINLDGVKWVGYEGVGVEFGNVFFEVIIYGCFGIVFSIEDENEGFVKVGFDDKKLCFNFGEMLDEVEVFSDMSDVVELDSDFLLILVVGECCLYIVNMVIWNLDWMKLNDFIFMLIYLEDVVVVGLKDGGWVKVVIYVGEVEVFVVYDKCMKLGMFFLFNGFGFFYLDDMGEDKFIGVSVNEFILLWFKDKYLGILFYKFVLVRLEGV